MIDDLRNIIDKHGRLATPARDISIKTRLGLSSFAAVQVMIALEEHFEVEFSDEILGLHRFNSIDAMLSLLTDAGVPVNSGSSHGNSKMLG